MNLELLDTFRAVVRAAAETTTRAGGIVTFGIPPERAETGYGWLGLAPGVHVVDAAAQTPHPLAEFVEKPDVAAAVAGTRAPSRAGAARGWRAPQDRKTIALSRDFRFACP